MAVEVLSPEVAYATKPNVKYPGNATQAAAAITAAQSRLTDEYPTLTITVNAGAIVPAT